MDPISMIIEKTVTGLLSFALGLALAAWYMGRSGDGK